MITDAYKVRMSQVAGNRRETFVGVFRKYPGPGFNREGGCFRMTEEVHQEIQNLVAPYDQEVSVKILPINSWFPPGAPWIQISGPNRIVSPLEASISSLYRLWIEPHIRDINVVNLDAKVKEIRQHIWEEVVENNIWDVSLRSSNIELHYDRLMYLRKNLHLSKIRTSMVEYDPKTNTQTEFDHTISAGSMGHENMQRFGSDADGFRAILSTANPNDTVFCLLDTFRTLSHGYPAFLQMVEEFPGQSIGIRLDNESTMTADFLYLGHEFQRKFDQKDLPPIMLSGGMTPEKIEEMFEWARRMDYPVEKVHYQLGGWLYKVPKKLGRDDFSSVYKLTSTNNGKNHVRKIGAEANSPKASILGGFDVQITMDSYTICLEEEDIGKTMYESLFSEALVKSDIPMRRTLEYSKAYTAAVREYDNQKLS